MSTCMERSNIRTNTRMTRTINMPMQPDYRTAENTAIGTGTLP